MREKLEQKNEKCFVNALDEKAQKLKTSMMYYFKSRQCHDNLLMFVMDV